jgi:hypothetical protein
MTDKLHTSRNSPNGAALLLAQPKELATQGWVKTNPIEKSEEQRDPRRLSAEACAQQIRATTGMRRRIWRQKKLRSQTKVLQIEKNN